MRVVAVPAKAFRLSKSRLAPVLTPAERASLSAAMLEDVLAATAATTGWERWMVSADPAVLALAERLGARAVPEERRSLLAAVRQAEALAAAEDAEALAVVLADLPLLSTPALAAALAEPAAVVLAPAESDGGTNLLLRRPPGVIRARFGRDSFRRHLEEAGAAGVAARVIRRPELAFDLDGPADLDALARRAARPGGRGTPGPRTRAVCLELDVAGRLRAFAAR